jgi:cytochrome c-type biogenesis protein CcmH
MLVWLLFAGLTAAVLAVLLRPFSRARLPRLSSDDNAADLAVYRDQLAQLDDDARRGTMGAEELESAKLEVARRILKTADVRLDRAPSPDADARRETRARLEKRVLIAIATLIPVFAVVLYLGLGSPWLPSKPYAGGGQPVKATASLVELIQRVETRLRQHPEDGTGWDVIAPVYFKAERFEEAATAYGNAVRILGETPARLAGFAEATVLANGGRVVAAARAAYEKLLKADPGRYEPRFWLALGREQDGDTDAALGAYQALLADPAVSAEGRRLIAERIATLDGSGQNKHAPPKEFGRSVAAIEAAGQLSDDERRLMITRMVEGLAQRLQANGQDRDGWTRLIRSYVILGRLDDAKAALATARKTLSNDPLAMAEFAKLGTLLGGTP